MQENLVELFRNNLLGDVRFREEKKEIIYFRWSCRKTLERHASRFTHRAPHSKLLLGKRINQEEIPN